MKEYKISCPHCGTEYLPAEIYIPNEFFGKPKNVSRDARSGKIFEYFGTEMDTEEEYRCDRCNTKFKVVAYMKFDTYALDNGNSDEYVTKVNKSRITMNED